jgi:DNA-binding transcriptional regulator YhcF (GntR family)
MTPSERIAEHLRARIRTGELAAGERLPSTRQLTRDWGVAIATATRALAALREEGLVRSVPGVGTVVASPTRVSRRPTADRRLTLEALVRQGIALADTEGLAAVSMRGVATALGVATMALYRYVPGKEQLLLAMADTVFADNPLPEPLDDWRAEVEQIARFHWEMYRRHPWLAHVISITRPDPLPHGMYHTDRALRALGSLGLDPSRALHAFLTLFGHVRGLALNLEAEAEAEQETGLTGEEWMEEQDPLMRKVLAGGGYPALAALFEEEIDLDLDSLFEFGLARLLDGIAAMIGSPECARGRSESANRSHTLERPVSG